MAPASTTTTTSQPSAATRVFAIPELLEHIFLALATRVRLDYSVALEPVATMSRCKSVNRTFYATISQSTKVQRLIQYAASEGIDAGAPLDQALAWLFEHKLNLSLSVYHILPDGGTLFRLRRANDWYSVFWSPINRTPEFETFRQRHNAPEATWRQVLSASHGNIGFDYKACKSISSDQTGSYWPVTGSLDLEPEDTLGMLFDKYCTIIDKAV